MRSFFDASEILSGSVIRTTTDPLDLSNGMRVATYPCRPASIRGLRARWYVSMSWRRAVDIGSLSVGGSCAADLEDSTGCSQERSRGTRRIKVPFARANRFIREEGGVVAWRGMALVDGP